MSWYVPLHNNRFYLPSTDSYSNYSYLKTVLRPLSSGDWRKLLSYSIRVRTFGLLGTHYGSELDFAAWRALSVSPISLFPKLQKLTWDENAKIFPYIRLFLGPLTHLNLWNIPTSHASILPMLAEACPSVKSFKFQANRLPNSETNSAISCAILGWQSLECLGCNTLPDEVYAHVANMPGLRSLSIYNLSTTYTARPGSQYPLFKSLVTLSLGGDILNFCRSVICHLSYSPIQEVVVTSNQHHEANDVKRLLKCIQSHCSQTSLQSVRYEVDIDDEFPEDDEVAQDIIVNERHLKPLYSFRNMVEVVIVPYSRFEMGDTAILELAKAWPKLQVLNLGSYWGWSPHIGISLQALMGLVDLCPDLVEVRLAINVGGIDGCSARELGCAHVVQGTKVRFLDVCDSLIEHPTNVAVILSVIFPNLEILISDGHETKMTNPFDSQKYMDRWEEVENLLPTLAAAHRLEKQRTDQLVRST